MSTSKVTQAELIDLFGETIPMEVVNLIFGPSSEKMTIGEVRAEIRKIHAATISQLQAEIARYREALSLSNLALEHASFALDGVVSLDDEDEGKDGGSDTCQHAKRTVDRALKKVRAALGGSND